MECVIKGIIPLLSVMELLVLATTEGMSVPMDNWLYCTETSSIVYSLEI